jgi:hypothetical protein
MGKVWKIDYSRNQRDKQTNIAIKVKSDKAWSGSNKDYTDYIRYARNC